MDHLRHNRAVWNRLSTEGSVWARPVDAETVARARAGEWRIILTPKLPVPREWLGEVRGRDVLCLASGGGQQVPVLAAAGARVVSFDLSEEQLAKDREVAAREGLPVTCLRGDMADLGALASERFDLVVHPASNVFVPDVQPVWRECFRVLRPGGELLAGFVHPAVFLFDPDESERAGDLVVRHALPYADVDALPPERLRAKLERSEPLEWSHSLEAQIGGQLAAGFVLTGLYEDRWFDESWRLANLMPIAIATRARKPFDLGDR